MALAPDEPAEANRYVPGERRAARMLRKLGRAIAEGRTTPGAPQANDVPVALYK